MNEVGLTRLSFVPTRLSYGSGLRGGVWVSVIGLGTCVSSSEAVWYDLESESESESGQGWEADFVSPEELEAPWEEVQASFRLAPTSEKPFGTVELK